MHNVNASRDILMLGLAVQQPAAFMRQTLP